MPPDSCTVQLRAVDAAINAREIAPALSMMTPDGAWPRAFKGSFVTGPDAVPVYGAEPWSEIDPHDEPIPFYSDAHRQVLVDVHQVVQGLNGALLADDIVKHRFTKAKGLIRKMDLETLPT